MPAPSQTEIVNGALADLGSRARITAISDTGNAAREARAHWDSAVRELLTRHTWNFAITRAFLPLQETLPTGMGWTYAYTLLPDCVRWLPPSREDTDLWFEGEEEGGRILTDREAPLPIRYVSNAAGANVPGWPPHFAAAVRAELAKRMADAITQSESTVNRAIEMAAKELARAKRADGLASGRTSRRQVTIKSDWLGARDVPYQRYGR